MVDGRHERWAEHRVHVREHLIECAVRAIDRHGPAVSMREIAAEANVPKPTLYRWFTDKAELAGAIADRSSDLVSDEVISATAGGPKTIGGYVRSAVDSFLRSVADQPNIFRFLLLTATESASFAKGGFERTAGMVGLVAAGLRSVEAGGTAGTAQTNTDVELDAHLIIGTVISAAHWWVTQPHEGASIDDVIDRVEYQVRSMIQRTANAHGVHLDFDAPITDFSDVSPTA